MKLSSLKKSRRAAYTLVEVCMAGAATSLVLAALVAGSMALQRTFAATLDYANGQDDQMRISDYLAVDMRRSVGVTTSSNGVTITLPNFYQSDGTPYPPTVTSTMGWPTQKKKQKKHKHRNIIMSQSSTYNGGATQAVKYYLGSASSVGKDPKVFYREVNGVATAIANDVSDFNVAISEDNTTATTQITFNPRFKLYTDSNATAGTKLYQTTLFRNVQLQ